MARIGSKTRPGPNLTRHSFTEFDGFIGFQKLNNFNMGQPPTFLLLDPSPISSQARGNNSSGVKNAIRVGFGLGFFFFEFTELSGSSGFENLICSGHGIGFRKILDPLISTRHTYAKSNGSKQMFQSIKKFRPFHGETEMYS